MSDIPTRDRSTTWVGAVSIAGMIVLFAAAILFYRNALLAATQRERADYCQAHTVQVIAKTQLLLSGLQDQETGQRGYLLTLDAGFLEAYTNGLSTTNLALPALVQLTADSPVQQRHLVAMTALIKTKQDGMAQGIALARAGKLNEAIARVRSGDGRAAMDDIRDKIEIIIAEETRLSVGRDASAAASIDAVRNYLNLFALFVLLLLVVTLITVIMMLRGRGRAWTAQTVLAHQRRVEADRDFLQSVIDTINDPIYVKDMEGRYMLANQRTADLLGVLKSEVLGKTDADFLPKQVVLALAQTDTAIVTDNLTRVVEEVSPVHGSMRTFLSSKTAWRVNGVVAGIIGVSHDITERKTAETALSQLNNELEDRVAVRTAEFEASRIQIEQMQKLEALGQLTSGVAHDFNNILAAIASGFTLIERKVDDDYVRMVTKHCRDAAFRGAKIVRQMMAFARQEVLAPVPLDISALIKEIEPMIRQAIPGNIIKFDFPRGLPKVVIDPALLEAALLNLAGNANDAMLGGGTLTLSARRNDETKSAWPIELAGKDAVILTVQDTGSGMSPDVLSRVVEPFYTTKPVGKGTGLGLAMVAGFITQSGGALRIESTQGIGTIVKLYLPSAGHESDHLRDGVVSAPVLVRGTGSLLLLDDDPNLRPLVGLQLQAIGYRVTEAADTATALAHLDAGTAFDVVLSDVVMAGGDGIEFARSARQRQPNLPILFMTGRGNTGRLAGETVIFKPFTIEDLSTALVKIVDDSTRQRTDNNEPPALFTHLH